MALYGVVMDRKDVGEPCYLPTKDHGNTAHASNAVGWSAICHSCATKSGWTVFCWGTRHDLVQVAPNNSWRCTGGCGRAVWYANPPLNLLPGSVFSRPTERDTSRLLTGSHSPITKDEWEKLKECLKGKKDDGYGTLVPCWDGKGLVDLNDQISKRTGAKPSEVDKVLDVFRQKVVHGEEVEFPEDKCKCGAYLNFHPMECKFFTPEHVEAAYKFQARLEEGALALEEMVQDILKVGRSEEEALEIIQELLTKEFIMQISKSKFQITKKGDKLLSRMEGK